MQMSSLGVESYCLTDIGLSRSNNEDVFAELSDCHFYALADGMGGHRAGEVAAKETVLFICDRIDALLSENKPYSTKEMIRQTKKIISDAHTWIRTLSRNHPELAGMGTTFCSILLYGRSIIYAHVGDSRIYRFKNRLERLTSDHSLRQELLLNGDLTEKEALSFPKKNVLTRAMGTSASVHPDVSTLTVGDGDLFLLCSDGLTDVLSDPEIEQILSKKLPLKELGIELVDQAKLKKSGDNITIVLIKIYETDLPR